MRTLCSSTLIGEAMVIGFAALVASRLTDIPGATLWLVTGVAMVLCVALCGALDRAWAVPVGWGLQAALVAAGFVVPMMFLVGALFAVIWWLAVHYGRKVDVIRAQRAAA
ncbi:DUF4233 domain-containing protein [Allostreptomyces psammosilenae]|uniref:DUF4233 domain-containing protein n=1 Tax=Allostreptomyces psammosilenae TaxID=1892865 RepID=A0A852ZXX2_9ACTN|nr:DUF4233 domain-containing protein [Allostreptomyces psammosilenae]NYI06627.1 hypothetical protein [Allostreptomyces psammosilenae]